MPKNQIVICVLATLAITSCQAFTTTSSSSSPASQTETSLNLNRRSFVSAGVAVAGGLVGVASPAFAGIDPALLKSLPVQGDESGTAQRLRQIEAIQKPASDLVDVPFENLPSGVLYREYREGKGEAVGMVLTNLVVVVVVECASIRFKKMRSLAAVHTRSTRGTLQEVLCSRTIATGSRIFATAYVLSAIENMIDHSSHPPSQRDCVSNPKVCNEQEQIRVYPNLRFFVDGEPWKAGDCSKKYLVYRV
jgi:hypothetical protein